MELTGSQIVIECLKEQGVDTVFGYPGGTILNIYDELYRHPEIHHILTSHEQGAAHAADGYARATGKTGVCMATSGPGATNLVTGIATAYMDSTPMVAITCNVGFEGMDFTGVAEFCKHLEIPYEQVDTEIARIVFQENKDIRPCSLCAKLRQGAMYQRLGELGINKMAYAHNKDDFIETALMSLIYEGRFYAFPPVTELPEAGVTVIRPMMYVPEQGVAHFVADQGIRVVKNTCPVDGSTKRAYAKQLMEQINRETPGAKDRIMHAIVNGRFPDWPL